MLAHCEYASPFIPFKLLQQIWWCIVLDALYIGLSVVSMFAELEDSVDFAWLYPSAQIYCYCFPFCVLCIHFMPQLWEKEYIIKWKSGFYFTLFFSVSLLTDFYHFNITSYKTNTQWYFDVFHSFIHFLYACFAFIPFLMSATLVNASLFHFCFVLFCHCEESHLAQPYWIQLTEPNTKANQTKPNYGTCAIHAQKINESLQW